MNLRIYVEAGTGDIMIEGEDENGSDVCICLLADEATAISRALKKAVRMRATYAANAWPIKSDLPIPVT